MNYLVCLEVSSWAGISWDAEHYYGKLKYYDASGDYHDVDVEHILSEPEAGRLSAKDRFMRPGGYRAGHTSFRFETRQAVIDSGLAQFREQIGQGLLVIGTWAGASPRKVLFAYPPYDKIEGQLNSIYAEYEAEHERIGWQNWNGTLDELIDEWHALLGSCTDD